jgi:hypothetical protein
MDYKIALLLINLFCHVCHANIFACENQFKHDIDGYEIL